MDKLQWCLLKKGGIEVIEQNSNLANAYIQKAEETLASMRVIPSRDWVIATAYYTMYFSLYALMMRIGIKCEIHSCGMECMKKCLTKYFSEEEGLFLEKSMQARIDRQYYTNRGITDEQYSAMVKRAPEFLILVKDILTRITEEEIREVREKLDEEIKRAKDEKRKYKETLQRSKKNKTKI